MKKNSDILFEAIFLALVILCIGLALFTCWIVCGHN